MIALAALVGTPGPQHALWPGWSGLQEAAPGVWVDEPARAASARRMLRDATDVAEAFHGPFDQPRIVFCSTKPCAERFGIGPAGLSYGRHLVLLGPDGVNGAVLGHELSHIALHQTYGLRDLFSPRFAYWFDEGLAVYLSPDVRYRTPRNLEQAIWVLQARTLREWNAMIAQENWPDAYGAAGFLVAQIAEQIGHDGLRGLVASVQQGADFNAELARLSVSLDP